MSTTAHAPRAHDRTFYRQANRTENDKLDRTGGETETLEMNLSEVKRSYTLGKVPKQVETGTGDTHGCPGVKFEEA